MALEDVKSHTLGTSTSTAVKKKASKSKKATSSSKATPVSPNPKLDVVVMWLKTLEIQHSDAVAYSLAMKEEGFDSATSLDMITEEDLKNMNVKKGHIRVIMKAIKQANALDDTPEVAVKSAWKAAESPKAKHVHTPVKLPASKKPKVMIEDEEEGEELPFSTTPPLPAVTPTKPIKSSESLLETPPGVKAPNVKAWKAADKSQPAFPTEFEVIKNVVLQVTEIGNNHNKYYGLELHKAGSQVRLFTHYGRTDDLEKNPNAGMKENRYYETLGEALAAYDKIYKEKTSARKGYRPVNLSSSSIGSDKAKGRSSGEMGAETLRRSTKRPAEDGGSKAKKPKSAHVVCDSLHPQVAALVAYIYDEAKGRLTSTVKVDITAEGIRTPLGILSIEQVEQGENVLDEIRKELMRSQPRNNQLVNLSSDFYSIIPHKIGRSKQAMLDAVLRDISTVQEKRELLQLMKDVLQVNSDSGSNLLYVDDLKAKYDALDAEVAYVNPTSHEYRQVLARITESVSLSHKHERFNVINVFKVTRAKEQSRFRSSVGNVQQLFHGSRTSNFVGLISRGLLMPRVIVSEGGKRTDAGWLGNGIYFGHVDVASNYALPGSHGKKLILCNSVALGSVKAYNAITYGIERAPAPYHSCHGVMGTQFADHEYVVYDEAQQKIEYLLEVKDKGHVEGHSLDDSPWEDDGNSLCIDVDAEIFVG